MKKNISHKKAFVSIFAIYFSAIILSVLTAMYVLLIKQIQAMEIDSQSFQSLYVADSAFECMIRNEQENTFEESVFLPGKEGNLDDCTNVGNLYWVSEPAALSPVGQSIRATSVINLRMSTNEGDYCAIITTDVETADSSNWISPPTPNFMTIAGHNKACGSEDTKVVERVIDFYF